MREGILDLKSGDKIKLPVIGDSRGDLSFVEGGNHVPFAIERVYYLYHLSTDLVRGKHAHYDLEQIIIAIHGSFDLLLDDGLNKKSIHLSSPSEGVYIGNMVWREMDNFSDDCVCLVLASKKYDEADYIRSYEDFMDKCKKSN